jgi:transketolase
MTDLKEKVADLRRTIFKTICEGGGGHIPSCLSIVEILTVLYNKAMRVDPMNPQDPDRDRFILSKGHASVALYAVLADKGFITHEQLETYGHSPTMLGGHPDMYKVPGVEASTGALGHGFGFGVGMALAGKMDGKNYRVFTLLGDGECQEGSVWEAAMFAPQHNLDNLIAIIDYNKLQALDSLENIVSLEPLADKWTAFGWEVREVNGHDASDLLDVFQAVPFERDKPSLIIAHTTKGKGISFMEDVPIWHYRLPNAEEMKTACAELCLDELVLQTQ